MSIFMIDIEADGPIPGDYSMVCFGAVLVREPLDCTFYGRLKPISNEHVPEMLAISGFTRAETMQFPEPRAVLIEFRNWIEENSRGRPMFMSDNPFDWMFMCWYFHHFLGENPFGIGGHNLGSLYKGVVRNFFENFKHLRRTPHTHNPVDDAKGNAEALLAIKKQYDVKMRL
ncbi:MAG: hypothetical protein KDK34_23520 [Leptospiraceae bacterium]|nr:hypothetical protein [Leptospiraceae bacterium]MCB1323248.1 hypothetical protein [Leptospiraceae bacterium]